MINRQEGSLEAYNLTGPDGTVVLAVGCDISRMNMRRWTLSVCSREPSDPAGRVTVACPISANPLPRLTSRKPVRSPENKEKLGR